MIISHMTQALTIFNLFKYVTPQAFDFFCGKRNSYEQGKVSGILSIKAAIDVTQLRGG